MLPLVRVQDRDGVAILDLHNDAFVGLALAHRSPLTFQLHGTELDQDCYVFYSDKRCKFNRKLVGRAGLEPATKGL